MLCKKHCALYTAGGVIVNQSVKQSGLVQSLRPASPFDYIAGFHRKTKQTKNDTNNVIINDIRKWSPCMERNEKCDK